MTVAKALGGGFPVGACLASESAARGMVPGTHGSTHGGNPLAMAVAEAAFDIISNVEFLDATVANSVALRDGLASLAARHPGVVRDVRGKGMLVGVALHPDNRAFIAAARDRRLLVAGGGDNTVRLLPPINITPSEVEAVLERFEATCHSLSLAQAS
jgi:acetylornithine/N-succinyldiaminopimelate aminotransferase